MTIGQRTDLAFPVSRCLYSRSLAFQPVFFFRFPCSSPGCRGLTSRYAGPCHGAKIKRTIMSLGCVYYIPTYYGDCWIGSKELTVPMRGFATCVWRTLRELANQRLNLLRRSISCCLCGAGRFRSMTGFKGGVRLCCTKGYSSQTAVIGAQSRRSS